MHTIYLFNCSAPLSEDDKNTYGWKLSKVFYQYIVIITVDLNFYCNYRHDSVSKCTGKNANDSELAVHTPTYNLRYDPVIQTWYEEHNIQQKIKITAIE